MPSSQALRTDEGCWVKCDSRGQLLNPDCSIQRRFEEHSVQTLWDVVQYACDRYPAEPCVSVRVILERKIENKSGKRFEKLKLGDYKSKTFQEIRDLTVTISESLHNLEVNCSRVALFAETREEWLVIALACFRIGLTVCTMYSTLSDAGLVNAINETEVSLLVTSRDLFKRVLKLLPNCPNINAIILIEDQLEGAGPDLPIPEQVTVLPYSKLNVKKLATNCFPTVNKSDVAVVMYTSGSSGIPKGVELTHENIIASIIAFSVSVHMGPGDRYLAFLPLAHIIELVAELSCLSLGIQILYSSPNTITSKGSKLMDGQIGDARLGKPTFFMAVPLMLDRLIKGVISNVQRQGWLQKLVFMSALKTKIWLSSVPFVDSVLDYLVFWKAKEELGGELRAVGVGGAPCTDQTHRMFKAIFGCFVLHGYGATECAASATGMEQNDISTGHVGSPNYGVYLKLVDWEEGNYFTTDQPNPRGEIFVGGNMVAKGYFERPEETKQAFLEEHGKRWFRTGDIGEVDGNGCLRIIDRKKDLVKLRHGEYIALASIECVLSTHPVVELACVVAWSTKDNAVAIIVPAFEELKKYGNNHINNRSLETLCNDEAIKRKVLTDLQNHGLKYGLNKWELPAAIHISADMWTTDSGLITPSFKIRRNPVENHFKDVIINMYANL